MQDLALGFILIQGLQLVFRLAITAMINRALYMMNKQESLKLNLGRII